MNPPIRLRASITGFQAERLQKRISALPFKVQYQEEQHGQLVVALIGCTNAQERFVREMLQELGASVADQIEGKSP